MRKLLPLLSLPVVMLFLTLSMSAFSQTTTVIGTIRNSLTGEVIPAVSVTIKGTASGTFTDDKGNFRLNSSLPLPLTLIISSVGYEQQEITVSNPGAVAVSLVPAASLGTEVVVAASRVPERILESPVSIERMSTANIRNAAVQNFYEAVANLKGADMATSSINFRTISTRGFNGSGNLRLNQLVDGMDNQAPALNFAVGNLIGITELDIENVELLQGASSALYGSGGMNGTLLMNSKNPFRYQGFSFQVKQGVNHLGKEARRDAAPVYDWSFRWGKKINDRFAFKISGQFIKAQDWQANDTTNLLRNNVLSKTTTGTRASDPNYDGVNVYGDEASTSMQFLGQLALTQVPSSGLLAYAGLEPTVNSPSSYNNAITTLNTINSSLPQGFPFYLGTTRGYYGAQLVSRTGYYEKDMVNYNAYNIKLSGGLYYKLTDNVEASLIGYWGQGSTVYTGFDRYNIKNFRLAQYKAEVKSDKWFLRAYTTQENSGDSYTATISSVRINEAWKSNTNWFQQYTGTYGAYRSMGFTDAQAHAQARTTADNGRLMPGTDAFKHVFDSITTRSISDGGGKFADKSSLYHFEGQYNLSDYVKVLDVLVGTNYRIYHLNSNGTIFADTAGAININEYGAYLQASRKLFSDVLKLTGSIRYDKNENFKGRFTPRITALVGVAKDNNIRLSFQTAYRFPSTQDQWINLNSPSARLIGGLPAFNTFFNFSGNPLYTAESVAAYRGSFAAGSPNPALLQQAPFVTIKPETMNSYEVGYRGLIQKRLLVDAYVYYSVYQNFLAKVAAARGTSGNPAGAPAELLNPGTTENFSFPVNTAEDVNAFGWGISADYLLPSNYVVNANVSGDQLDDLQPGLIAFFNTPKVRFNVGFSNSNVYKNFGFNFIYRWQDKLLWEGTFGSAEIPAYGTLDGQVSYTLRKIKSIIKLGASNLTNNYYRSAFGNPYVGGLYYVSFGYNVF